MEHSECAVHCPAASLFVTLIKGLGVLWWLSVTTVVVVVVMGGDTADMQLVAAKSM